MRQENRIGKAFDCVRASEELKASTKEFLRDARGLEQGRSKNRGLSRPAFRLALSAAGAMLTVFLCIGAYAMLWMPVAYVSIDLNPSLELALNRLDRVIGVEAYNEDGQGILEGVSVKGMRYGDAIESIVGSEGMQPYLTRDAALTFTVATDSAPREEQMLEEIARSSGCVEHGGVSVRADMSLVEEAHGNGMSLGKYLAYQVLLRYEPTVTVEDCHEMSMSQINGRIEEHEHGANHGDGHGGRHGGGTEPEAGDGAGTGTETGDGMTDENSQFNGRPGEAPSESSAESPALQPTEQDTEQPAGQDTDRHREEGHGHRSGHGR
nr:hypothetical protein [uncultured Acetatifactor sp.]